MASSFSKRVEEAQKEVGTVSVAEAKETMDSNPKALVIDVRDAADTKGTGVIPGAANISLGTLFYKADHEMPEAVRDARLEDKDTPILVACAKGGQASVAGKVLKDYGYSNVKVIEGGTLAWKEAGHETEDVK